MTSASHDVSSQSRKRTVSERNAIMINNRSMSDVSFVCGETGDRVFYAHKYMLCTASAVFQAMFYGGLAERESRIRIPDADENCFEEFLRFLYVDDCAITERNAIGLLYLAEKYDILALIEKCCQVLEASIDHKNVFEVLKVTRLFKERELEGKCWDFVSINTSECLNSRDFCDIDSEILVALLKKVSCLDITDIELFKAVVKWADSKCSERGLNVEDDRKARRRVLGDGVYAIRFLAMSQDDIIDCVSFTGILTNKEIVGILQRLRGHDVPGLKWKVPGEELELVTITRFDAHAESDVAPDSWYYVDGKTNALTFTVNEDVSFLGVRLFGDNHGSSYSVKFRIKEIHYETRSYISRQDRDGVWGYDVMLPRPLSLQRDEEVTMKATIEGPESFKGSNGKLTMTVGDIVVHFHDAPLGLFRNHTSKTEGQFYKIFLRKL